MRFIANRIIAGPHFDPGKDLESPEDAQFATAPISKSTAIFNGISKPLGHEFANGQHGISKSDAISRTFEPLAYHLGKQFHVSVPPTVLRKNQDEPTIAHGLPTQYSVQQRVAGLPFEEINNKEDRAAVHAHPDFHKMALFDWMMANRDRHGGNFLYDKARNQVHAIDNGMAGDYRPRASNFQQTMPNGDIVNSHIEQDMDHNLKRSALSGGNIPEDFRKAVTTADPAEHAALWARYMNHPTFDKMVSERQDAMFPGHKLYPGVDKETIRQDMPRQYLARLATLKRHFADPNIRTMKDVYKKLYPYMQGPEFR